VILKDTVCPTWGRVLQKKNTPITLISRTKAICVSEPFSEKVAVASLVS
jgi:hypothetical protein